MNDRKERVLKWINFGVSLTNTVLYPYKKTVRFGEIQAEKSKSALAVVSSDVPPFDSEIIAELSYDLDDLYQPVSKIKSAINYFAQIIDYVNYVLMAGTALDFLLKLDDKDLSFLGIKISKGFLKVVKWVLLGAGALVVISICMEKLFGSKLFAAVNKKLKDFLQKLLPYVSTLLKIIFALYAIYLIYVLIKLQIDGKKWKINDTEKLLSGIVMLLGVLDIKWVEERLADSKQGYIIATGISFIAKASKTALIPFTTSEPININKDKFEKVATDAETLFLYFCGTRENTDKHLDRFMPDIKAKYQIYISGIGSSQAIYEKLYDDGLEVKATQLGKNSRQYHFENSNRSITCIEKVYTGGDLGYNKSDVEQVTSYAFNAFKDVFVSHAKIKKIIIVGHSRGAAVALMSFLYKLIDLDKITRKSESLVFEVRNPKIAIFPLDPVAGQTGNNYPMGEDWTSQDIYDKLHKKFSSNLSICEVWARSASMLDLLGIGADFHPARRMLHNPTVKSLMLSRFLLGYEHSAMVSTEEKYVKHYLPNLDSPYTMFVKFLNNYIDSLSTLNAKKFKEISKNYSETFNKTDKLIRDAGVMNYEKGIRNIYKNYAGERINFLDFITSFVTVEDPF